jgi:CRP/FNR family cyclic AMP-dependent transcriptional regulator
MKEPEQKDFIDALASVSLFSGLNKKHLETVAKLGHDLSFKEGQAIVKEGELGIGFYVILEGKAEVRIKDKLLSKLAKGDFFGEMAILNNRPRNADVIALEPTRCVAFTAWSFDALVRQRPEIPSTIKAEMEKRKIADAKLK